jgi:hypothetical protein
MICFAGSSIPPDLRPWIPTRTFPVCGVDGDGHHRGGGMSTGGLTCFIGPLLGMWLISPLALPSWQQGEGLLSPLSPRNWESRARASRRWREEAGSENGC